MACRNPVCIDSPLGNKKHIYVPCGRCAWCRRSKRQEWVIRFKLESKENLFTKFITLTYSDENLPVYFDEDTGEYGYRCRVSDVQKFVKRMRKSGLKFKYFIVSEYAPITKRPHLHGLIFSNDDINDDTIRRHWQQGNTDTQNAGEASFSYVAKYILKGSDRDGNFMLCSKNPAIAKGYIKRAVVENYYRRDDDGIYQFYYTENGKKFPLPRYFKKKLKDFIDPIEFDLNKIKLLHQMEERPKQFYLEKMFSRIRDNPVNDLLQQKKFEDSITAAYQRDLNQQYKINSKEKK